jgi:hypothetical protein
MAKKRTPTRKKEAPAGEAPLGNFPDGAWVEIFHEGEWKLARIRFFIHGQPWIRWNDEGDLRVPFAKDTRARKASAPGDVFTNTSEATGQDEADPLLRR